MTLLLDHPQVFQSPLGRLDPRWKLAALALSALAVALLETVPAAAAALILAWLLVLLGRIPWRWYLRRLGTVAFVVAFFVVWLPWLVPDEGLTCAIGPLRMSWPGLALACRVLLKALALVTLMLVLWVTAPLDSTVKAAHALRLPGLVVQLIVLTYRYIFLLAEELGRLRTALRVRGYRNRPNLHSYRTVGHVTGTLLVRGYERAERVSQAMRCRGFDGRFRSLADFHTRPIDVFAFVAISLTAAGLVVWDFLGK